ncbi:MAG: nucleotidyltransferase domain-containing protein [Caldilineaceae bacterium]|nr:nucleotidyltransferase domain-containing protein [Caldilineaceae bacterium]
MSGCGEAAQGDGKMVQVTDALLEQMVEKIVAEVDPEQIILFGSRARGDARAGSDVDLAVVESEPFGQERSKRLEAARLYRTLSGFLVSKYILEYSRDEVDYWRDSFNHVLARALREGRVLYERR